MLQKENLDINTYQDFEVFLLFKPTSSKDEKANSNYTSKK